MAGPAWDAGTSLGRLQGKVRRAQSLSARWSEIIANSLSSVDAMRKRLEQEAALHPATGQLATMPSKITAPPSRWLVELSENLDLVCENLESCFDQVGSLQNALDDAADITEGLDAQVCTMQQQLNLSRQEVVQLRSKIDPHSYKDLLDGGEGSPRSPSNPNSIEQLKSVVEVLQTQLHTAQELLADRQREVQILERRISSQSEAVVGVIAAHEGREQPEEEDTQLPAQAVVEVLQTQIKAAQEQLAEKDTEVRRLERRLSSIPSRRTSDWSGAAAFASFTGADRGSEDGVTQLSEEDQDQDLSPVSMLRASKEVLQSQFSAAKECLAQKDAEIAELKAEKERLQRQVSTLQQRLSNVQVAMLQQQLDQVNCI